MTRKFLFCFPLRAGNIVFGYIVITICIAVIGYNLYELGLTLISHENEHDDRFRNFENLESIFGTSKTELVRTVSMAYSISYISIGLALLLFAVLFTCGAYKLAGEEYLCHACYCHMWERINQDSAQPPSATMGLNMCVICSKSILGIRSRKLLGTEKSKRGRIVAHTIAEWIHPRELQPSDGVCIPCWLRAKRATNKSQQNNRAEVMQERPSNTATASPTSLSLEPPKQKVPDSETPKDPLSLEPPIKQGVPESETPGSPESQEMPKSKTPQMEEEPQIKLPVLRRAAANTKRCLFLNCNQNQEKRQVPDSVRRRVLTDFNFYIPTSARICTYHLGSNLYKDLNTAENAMSTFTAEYVEDMVFLLREVKQLDFTHAEDIDDHLFKYWFGRTKQEYNEIIAQFPRLNDLKIKLGLNALLCKMKTGDSTERMSALFQIPNRTLGGYMNRAREILLQDYIPGYSGLAHISRMINVLNKMTE